MTGGRPGSAVSFDGLMHRDALKDSAAKVLRKYGQGVYVPMPGLPKDRVHGDLLQVEVETFPPTPTYLWSRPG